MMIISQHPNIDFQFTISIIKLLHNVLIDIAIKINVIATVD